MSHVITTDSGIAFDFDRPSSEMVCVEDIARALSNVCRFGGHVVQHYSVAQHAVFVRDLVVGLGHPELGFAALHHDSHEAYTGDIPTPLKVMLAPAYYNITDRVDTAIAEAFGIDPNEFDHAVIKTADAQVLRYEGVQLKSGPGAHRFAQAMGFQAIDVPQITPLSPRSAEREFLAAHDAEVRARREPAYA